MTDSRTRVCYVHGFGGKDHDPDFCRALREEFERLQFRCVPEVFAWDSVQSTGETLVADWLDARQNAETTAPVLSRRLLDDFEEQGARYYIVAFSLGARLVCSALNGLDEPLRHCRGIYLLGAAVPGNYKVNRGVLPPGVKIRNHYSPRWGWVLKKMYSNAERIPPAGTHGFDDLATFENLPTGCCHKNGPNKYTKMARPIAEYIAFREGHPGAGDCLPNVRFPTAGGTVWWSDIVQTEEYRVQFNVFLGRGWYRAICREPSQDRLAWSNRLHPILTKLGYSEE